MATTNKEQAKQAEAKQEQKTNPAAAPAQNTPAPTKNGKTTVRVATDPSNFEVVQEIPPITRTGGGGPRKSKWDGVIQHLKDNPGTKVMYTNVSASLGTDLSSRFLVRAQTRDVTDDNRCTMYLVWDQEYADRKLAKREARAKAKAEKESEVPQNA